MTNACLPARAADVDLVNGRAPTGDVSGGPRAGSGRPSILARAAQGLHFPVRGAPGRHRQGSAAAVAQPRASPSRPSPTLSPLDEGIVHLDSASEPWSVHLELRLAGPVDGARLRRALMTALACHPRARARLALPPDHRRYRWQVREDLDVDPFDELDCASDDEFEAARADLQSVQVPLVESPPLRMRLAHHPSGDVVMVNLHHAAADGMAAVRLLRSVAVAYAGGREQLPAVSAETLRIPSQKGWRRVRITLEELWGAARRHAHLVPDGGSDAPGYGFCQLALSAPETDALRRAATAGVTVNDLLLAALHLSIDRWNGVHGRPPGRIGVLMPVNLRPRELWDEVVGNFTFMLPVSTARSQRVSPEATIDTVRARTRRVKEERRGAAVVGLLRHLQRLPARHRRAVARLASAERVIPSAILSNLGRLDGPDFGRPLGRPMEAWFSPPATMPLGLAVGAVTTGGRLHLSFRHRHPLFGRSQAEVFARSFVDALHVVVSSRAGQPPAEKPDRAA